MAAEELGYFDTSGATIQTCFALGFHLEARVRLLAKQARDYNANFEKRREPGKTTLSRSSYPTTLTL